MDNFITLFDNSFLPIGLNLYTSLKNHSKEFKLWILCLDEQVYKNLEILNLTNIQLIKLEEIETPELLSVKSGRSRAEYCWTLTPFTLTFVFTRDPTVKQITYVDADLFFFSDPRIMIDEMENEKKDVLITEHAYDPKYDASRKSGRFCVQFLTINNTSQALSVIKWWQDKCIEWCFCKFEEDRFGDQKYLDKWPTLFKETVHILKAVHLTLAPWNANYICQKKPGPPALYHFHGLRILGENKVRLYYGFNIGKKAKEYYKQYIQSLAKIMGDLKSREIRGITVSKKQNPEHFGKKGILSIFKSFVNVHILKMEAYSKIRF